MESGNPHHRQTIGNDQERIVPSAPNIGDPMTFVAGQFAGRTIRTELEELQKAESGRKYAKVDRRPLDPPPAVLLRLYETTPQPGAWERELVYKDEVMNVGLICTVDLFPVPESALYEPRSPASQSPQSSSSSHDVDFRGNHNQFQPLTYFPLHPFTSAESSSGCQMLNPPFQIPRRQPMLSNVHPSDEPPDVVFRIGDHLVTESSKLTPALVGEKFAEPTLVDYKGKNCFIFVFGDVAVRREGVFILRYRAFDIFSGVAGSPHSPVLAELYGGPFKVFSTREFPGLEPSTVLTKSLAKYGVRVTLRDAERKSKKRNNLKSISQ